MQLISFHHRIIKMSTISETWQFYYQLKSQMFNSLIQHIVNKFITLHGWVFNFEKESLDPQRVRMFVDLYVCLLLHI